MHGVDFPSYYKAMRVAAGIQVLIIFVAGLILDGGATGQLCVMALLPFWTTTIVLVWRRPQQPTQVDLSFVRIGYLLVLFATILLAPLIWRLRGVL